MILIPTVLSAARSTVDESKTRCLTFDGGPSAHTPEILELLARYGVKAAFSAVAGRWNITAAGHALEKARWSGRTPRAGP